MIVWMLQLSFCFHLHGISFFHPLTFSLCVPLDLKWVSYRQCIYRSFFLNPISHSMYFDWNSLFTFKVIIDSWVLIIILLIAFCCFYSSFLFFSSFALFSWDLMTIFSVIFNFFLFFACIYYRFLVCGYRDVYIYSSLYIYKRLFQVDNILSSKAF